MANVLADLLVRFGADSADLRKSLKTVQGDVSKFTKDISGMKSALEGAFAAAGIGVAAHALAEMVKSGAEAAEQMGKMAQVAGLSVEEMSRLAFAAKMGDLSTDQLSKGVLKLSEAMTKGAAGGKEQAAIFEAMGFSARDLDDMLGDTHGALLMVADRIAGYADGAEKAALVSALFGDRLARELLPFLNQGANGIRSLEGESDRLGKTLSSDVVAGANEFNDALKRLSGSSQMFGAILANELAPSLTQFVDVMASGGSKLETMREVAEVASTGFKLVATGALYAYTFATMVGKSIGDVAASAERLAHLDFKGAVAADEAYKKDLEAFLLRMRDMKEAIWNPEKANRDATGWAPDGDPQSHTEARARAPLIDASAGAAKAEKFKLWWEEFKARVDAASKAIADADKNWKDEFSAKVEATSRAIEESSRIFEATRTPLEKYAAELERLDILYRTTPMDVDTYVRAVQAAEAELDKSIITWDKSAQKADEMSVMWKRAGENMQDILADNIVNGFKDGLDGMVAAFGNALARMAAQAAAAKIFDWSGIGKLFGGGGKDDWAGDGPWKPIADLIGGERANGGPVYGGKTYLVGERGPELFTPNISGAIVPNDALSAGSGAVAVHLTVTTISPQHFGEVVEANPGIISRPLYKELRRAGVVR